jgi:hypothetical protein
MTTRSPAPRSEYDADRLEGSVVSVRACPGRCSLLPALLWLTGVYRDSEASVSEYGAATCVRTVTGQSLAKIVTKKWSERRPDPNGGLLHHLRDRHQLIAFALVASEQAIRRQYRLRAVGAHLFVTAVMQ